MVCIFLFLSHSSWHQLRPPRCYMVQKKLHGVHLPVYIIFIMMSTGPSKKFYGIENIEWYASPCLWCIWYDVNCNLIDVICYRKKIAWYASPYLRHFYHDVNCAFREGIWYRKTLHNMDLPVYVKCIKNSTTDSYKFSDTEKHFLHLLLYVVCIKNSTTPS